MQNYELDKLATGAWDGTFTKPGGTAVPFGAVDSIVPNLELMLTPKTVGSLGPMEIGDWIRGVKGTVTSYHRQIEAETYQTVLPWYTTGSVSFNPAGLNSDLYEYAGLLNLHPQELPTATKTLDLNFLKAAPWKVIPPGRDGTKQDVIQVEWKIYPDRAQLSAGSILLAYAYVGAPPAPPPPP